MNRPLRPWLYRLVLAAGSAMRGEPKRHFSLGILKLDRLGDGVLALGAVRRLVRQHGEAKALLIVSPLAEPLFRAEFPAATVLVLPPFPRRFAPDFISFLLGHAHRIGENRVEQLVCLRHQPSDYLHGIAHLLRPDVTFASTVAVPWERISLGYPSARLADYPEAPGAQGRELEAHRRVVELALGEPVALAEVLPALGSVLSADGDALLICPEAGDRLRIYPPAQLAEAVRQFLALRPMPVEVCLPPASDPAPWRGAFHGVPVRCWHRPKDAMDLARQIAGAGLILATESAPAHLTAALDKRGVFLLGGGHFGLLAPWGKSPRQSWLWQRLDCYGCRWHCIFTEPRCITGIAPGQIAANLLQVLES